MNEPLEQSEAVITPLSIYLDNNVWDFLFERNLDLVAELPKDKFCICITREAAFEIPPIPVSKESLKSFIESTISRCQIQVDSFFGFYDESLPADKQRYAGFDQGRFASQDELAYIAQQRQPFGALRPSTSLYKNEADFALAVRSVHSVVISLDRKTGPINTAYQNGGKVVFLTDFDAVGVSLADFIRSKAIAIP